MLFWMDHSPVWMFAGWNSFFGFLINQAKPNTGSIAVNFYFAVNQFNASSGGKAAVFLARTYIGELVDYRPGNGMPKRRNQLMAGNS